MALSSSEEASTCSQPSQPNGNDGGNDSDIFLSIKNATEAINYFYEELFCKPRAEFMSLLSAKADVLELRYVRDHLPVLAKISLDGLSLFKNSVAEITRRPKIRWSEFDKYEIEEKYSKPLSAVLDNLDLDAGSTLLTQALIDAISKISFSLLSKTNTCKKSKAGKIYVKLPLTIKSAKSKLNDL